MATIALLTASPLAAGQQSPGSGSLERADLPGFAADMDSGLVDLALADPSQVAKVADARQLRLRGDRVVVEVLIAPGRARKGTRPSRRQAAPW